MFCTNDDNNTKINTKGSFLPPTIDARVWTMYQDARCPGKVLSVNDKRGIFNMRFDEFPRAAFDYSFSYKSSARSYIDIPPPSTDLTITTENENEPLFTNAKKFKALIKVKFLLLRNIF